MLLLFSDLFTKLFEFKKLETSLIEKLRGNKVERDEAIRFLVRDSSLKESIKKYVLANSGSDEDYQSIHADAIIAFAKKVFRDESFSIESSVQSYITGIAKFLWLDELKSRKKYQVINGIDEYELKDETDNQFQLLIKGERGKILQSVLDKMKTRCKDVIMYWAAKYNMNEIAEILGYKNEAVARKKKSECMSELTEYVKMNPHIKSILSND